MPSWELAMTGSYIIRIAPYSRYSKNKLADYEVQNGWWSTEEIILNCWKGQIYHAFTTRKNPCVNATLRKWPISIGMAMTPILGTVGGTITVRQISSLNRLDALVVCEFASLILNPGFYGANHHRWPPRRDIFILHLKKTDLWKIRETFEF